MLMKIEPVRTYASKANAIKAVENKVNKEILHELRYFVMPFQCTEGLRFFPVFVGIKAMDYGIHFHFNIIV